MEETSYFLLASRTERKFECFEEFWPFSRPGVLFNIGCKAKPDDKEAIKAGVIKHLASVQGLNVPNMEVTVTQFLLRAIRLQRRLRFVRKMATTPLAP